ncbi:uncharacterized protein LOC109857540 isoform X2 [Pseudomyrmex gracilis]|uniref:uncharacterized protein LOC109857540 isoform X2 n=1 Tax=Pseudomyrmex gracilis TaxID=219809 RepID=UPI000995AB0C|nr:uncharacterized protein LOC109857540 isoform X2 [Pseudomyrmex gracilis]
MSALKMREREEAPEVFREAILYREWGHRLTSLGRYSTAVYYYEKSSNLEAENLRTLIGLCEALMKYMRYFSARKVAEKCMEIDPGHYKVRRTRMEVLFQIGEFAHSLRGVRRDEMTFEHGFHQAYGTIEDCVGRNTSPVVLLLLYPKIRRLQEHRESLIGKPEEDEDEEFEGIDEDEARFKVNDPEVQQQARMKKLQRVIAKMYMGYLAIDKDFLEDIASRSEIVDSPCKSSAATLIALASTCHRKLVRLQELLRMRRPLYVTIFRKRELPKGFRMMMERERELRKNNIVLEADFLLRQLLAARISKDYPTFFKSVYRIKDKFDSYSDKMFPLKRRCLDALYKTIAWVYIDARNLTCLDDEKTKTRYLKHHLGIRVASLPRDSDLAWMPTANPKEMLKMFHRRLAMASAPLELAWLYHEFCKVLVDIRRFDLARFYAKKGYDVAQEARCDQWYLNIYHLLLRMEIHQNNRNEAREAAIVARETARKLGIDCLCATQSNR